MENPSATITIDNIRHNIKIIKAKVKQAKILAVIKANAYGHGALRIAKELEKDSNITAFAVSRFPEADALNKAGINKQIILLEGVLDREQLQNCATNKNIITIESLEGLELLKQTPLDDKISIWLKFNTGMNRLGFNYQDSQFVIKEIDNLIKANKVNTNYVVMTHFADADNTKSNFTDQQLKVFNEIIGINNLRNKINVELSAANSAGIFAWPDSHFDWVRPGISLYGSSPIGGISREELGLKPALVFTTKIISLKTIKKGEFVGYNCCWQAPRDTLIGIIACGYGDGYPRLYNNNSFVWINNKRCKIIGNISMDMMAIDCSSFDSSDIHVCNIVELWGNNINIDEVAKNHQTISYDLLCKITARVERVYV